MNKRGQIARLFMVLFAVVLVGVTLVSFAIFNNDFESESARVNLVLGNIDLYERYVLAEIEIIGLQAIEEGGSKADFQKIVDGKNLGVEGLENFFGKVGRGEFSFEKDGEDFVFRMDDLYVQAESGAGKMKRELDIVKRIG